ncbi:hypothetical protein PCASD_04844 [Puccinia coronata f. sp. avenae]|uniref:SCD domain-containing protein n=1 Tax=Puccinia coronata f. sp. avenae TaxID=200324 RepID=A0A2N5V218_9BASI|nr:hypothetical protein PCASD_04844 [Puccinia coronata f. sp. avenae]
MDSHRRSNRNLSSQQEDNQSGSIHANGHSSKRKSRASSASSNADSPNDLTPKRARVTSKPKSYRDHEDGSDQRSDSPDDHDDFTPKSTARGTATRGRARGRARGRGSAAGDRASGRQSKSKPASKLPAVKKPRKSNAKAQKQNPQAEQDGNETNRENTEGTTNLQAEYQINQDNDLFNTIRTGASAIQPTLEDWIDVYQGLGEDDEDAKGQAIAQLINFVLRCCGCNCSIDKYKALDIDAVTDTLDTIQETFKTVPSQAYPLIVKSGKSVSKNFRKNLISLTHQLVLLAHSNTLLYDEYFIPSVQSYLVSMSSSTLRSFRHTSTVISLFGFVSPMCELLVSTKKELTSLIRKVEVEAAKKNSSASKLEQLAEWQKRKKQVLKEKAALENLIGEFFDGVFVHRYRDADPSIRVDCVQALGQWMIMVPDYFLEGNYLRYIGWVITDSNKDARNEALRALCALYSKEENIGVMQHFTSRFRPRLIEMATGESDFTTRGLSINIVTQIDRHGLLDYKQRNQIGRLIYHEDSRVRKAASTFFGNLFEEAFDAQKMRLDAANQSSTNGSHKKHESRTAELETQIAFKCLAHLLLKLERAPKSGSMESPEGDGQSSDSEDERPDNDDDPDVAGQHVGSLYQTDMEKGRIDFAVEDLWPKVEVLHDWQSLCHYLLLDHTASINPPQTSSVPAQLPRSSVSLANTDLDGSAENEPHQHSVKDKTTVHDACKLSEPEETILVDVLVASLRKFGSTLTAAEALKMKKRKKRRLNPDATDEEGATTEDEAAVARRAQQSNEDEPENKADLTRSMISLLPKLWSKFTTDPVKLAEVFRIPKLMSLNMYMDLRMVSEFEELWDTMIKHYLKQQHVGTIQVICSTVAHVFSETKSLEHINQAKILKLHEALLSSLSDLMAGEPDLEKDDLSEDQVVSLTLLLTKVACLFRQSDMSPSIKSIDLNGTGPTSPYDGINALAKRAHLAHPSEAKLVEVALEILQLNFTWTSASIYRISFSNEASSGVDPPLVPEPGGAASLSEKVEYGIQIRDNLVKILTEYVATSNDDVNEAIKRAAFIHLLNTYLLCQGPLMPEDLRLESDEETQAGWTRFIEREIQEFLADHDQAKDSNQNHPLEDEENEDRDDEQDSDRAQTGPSRNSKKSKKNPAPKSKSKSLANQPKFQVPSVNELHRIEEFDLLITTFAKSIRCGLIHFQHSAVIIQHYTRLHKIFDISVELLIATLNDSIANTPDQNSLVIKCLADVFKASFELYLGPHSYTEDQFIRLSRLLQSVVVVRGARMTYKPRLDSLSAAKLHLDCIQWLVGKATLPEPEPPLMNQLGCMFRGLALLLIGIDGRSCLKIKTEMERLVVESSLSIPASKSWDAYHLYLKRLLFVMAKDPNIKRAARLALQKQGGVEASGAEEDVVNGAANNDDAEADMGPPPAIVAEKAADKTTRKSKPRTTKAKPKAREASSGLGDDQTSEVEQAAEGRGQKAAVRPTRPRSRSRESSRMPSSALSHTRRESSVVSVVIPVGPKRKRIVSERRPTTTMTTPNEAGHTPTSGSTQKRARLSAVVIGKSSTLNSREQEDPRKARNPGAATSSLRKHEEPQKSGKSTTRPDALSSANLPRASNTRARSSSSAASDMSLAAIKRQSRRQLQK